MGHQPPDLDRVIEQIYREVVDEAGVAGIKRAAAIREVERRLSKRLAEEVPHASA